MQDQEGWVAKGSGLLLYVIQERGYGEMKVLDRTSGVAAADTLTLTRQRLDFYYFLFTVHFIYTDLHRHSRASDHRCNRWVLCAFYMKQHRTRKESSNRRPQTQCYVTRHNVSGQSRSRQNTLSTNSCPLKAPLSTMDNELLRVWELVRELSDQLALNQKIASTLQSQAGVLKVGSPVKKKYA